MVPWELWLASNIMNVYTFCEHKKGGCSELEKAPEYMAVRSLFVFKATEPYRLATTFGESVYL